MKHSLNLGQSHRLCALTLAFVATGVHAGAFDGIVSLPSGFELVEYTNATLSGDGPAVGGGRVDQDNKFFYIDERTDISGNKSWYFFFDPKNAQSLGTNANPVIITFNKKITNLWTSYADMTSVTLNSTYGVDLDGDNVLGETKPNTAANALTSDYLTASNIGLESGDFVTQMGDYQIKLKFSATDPGDHFRVTTVVPEPEAYGLALAGLGVVAFSMRQRRRVE